jgi:hypothetical protein
MKKVLTLVAIGFSLLFIGCAGGGGDSDPTYATVMWEPDGSGFRQFYTDDPQYYSYWFAYSIGGLFEDPMGTVETEVKKVSGYANAAYGIIFCRQDWDNYYKLVISTTGGYRFSKLVTGVDIELIPWTASSNLLTGYGVVNKIKVDFNGTDTFTIFFNDTQEATNQDGTITFDDGPSGYYVWVSSEGNENLPDTPVDVRFKELQYVPDPSAEPKAEGQIFKGR